MAAPSHAPFLKFEDDHLLVISKSSGCNTHSPSPYANEGIYEYLRHREARWASLAIIHRLDKETSGLLVFGKTSVANRSLTQQFESRTVRKTYEWVTDRKVAWTTREVTGPIVRLGERYGIRADGQPAETHFEAMGAVVIQNEEARPTTAHRVRAFPRTGRTHQIRVHAAELGTPILGDVLYGGTKADRVYLHAGELEFDHPVTGERLRFEDPAPWNDEAKNAQAARSASRMRNVICPPWIDLSETDTYRLLHGASHPSPVSPLYLDRLGDYGLIHSADRLTEAQKQWLARRYLNASEGALKGIYYKQLLRHVRGTAPQSVSPELLVGEPAPEAFEARENRVRYEIRFGEGYSIGLFLDQRENRRRWICGHVAAGFELPQSAASDKSPKPELLNTFAYTCGFSVAAALGGWRTTSLDLSKKYLEWGKRNFERNQMVPAEHDFVFGDTFDWLRRWKKKGRRFDGIILDPPTFSESKEHGRFRAESDFGTLLEAALGVLNPAGVVLASTNAARLEPAGFVSDMQQAVQRAGRKILKTHYVPQPLDFPISKEEPGYLKTLWLQID